MNHSHPADGRCSSNDAPREHEGLTAGANHRAAAQRSDAGDPDSASPGTSQCDPRKTWAVLRAFAFLLAGMYLWAQTLIPVTTAVICLLIGRKIAKGPRALVLPPFAIQFGHLLWLTMGLIFTDIVFPGRHDQVHVAVLGIGLTWLVARPGAAPIVLLIVYQGLVAVSDAAELWTAAIASTQHRVALTHLILRVLGLILLGVSLKKLRQNGDAASFFASFRAQQY